MSKQLKVYVLREAHEPVVDNVAREVQDADIDTMRNAAKDVLVNSGYQIRTINFSPNGDIIAYVYRTSEVNKTAEPVAGWVFKRSNLKPTT